MEHSEKLKELIIDISKTDVQSEKFNTDTDLVNDLGMDSIKLIQLVVAIETELDIELSESDVDLSNLANFGKLSAIVESKSA